MPHKIAVATGVIFALLAAQNALAYRRFSAAWPQASTDFYMTIPGYDKLTNDTFVEAADQWNARTIFTIRKLNESRDPCSDPSVNTPANGVIFAPDVCGIEFGEIAQSVTLAITYPTPSGTRLVQEGIIFNSDIDWRIYDGPFRPDQPDFRRLAVHEFGHVIGLYHEDRVPAIMKTTFDKDDAVATPQSDDIFGVDAIYGPSVLFDDFADPLVFGEPSLNVLGDNFHHTKEPGEPNHAGNSGGASVWARWTAPISGTTTISTEGSDFDTLLAVYTGSRVDALTEVASNDDFQGPGGPSQVMFQAQSGRIYHIALDGWGGGRGNYQVSLMVSAAPLGNDLVLSFGTPNYVWAFLNDEVLELLSSTDPDAILIADVDGSGLDDVILDIPDFGLWIKRDFGDWAQFNVNSTVHLAAADVDNNGSADILADFGEGIGTWIKLNDTVWERFNVNTTGGITSGDLDGNGQTDVILNLKQYGTWAKMNNANWVKLNVNVSPIMAVGDLDGNGLDEFVLDIGSFGVWAKRNFGAWERINVNPSEGLAIGDIDGDGRQDLIMDMGASLGLWARKQDGVWSKIHDNTPEVMAFADLDSNGKADLVVNFEPGLGTWAYRNDTEWTRIFQNRALQIASGQLDGQ